MNRWEEMNNLVIIWGIIAFIFFILAIYHFNRARKNITHIDIVPSGRGGANIIMGNINIRQTLNQFQTQMNNFIDDFNSTNNKINIIQGIGYLVAFITALVSFYLTIRI